jgi:hypothetical protein
MVEACAGLGIVVGKEAVLFGSVGRGSHCSIDVVISQLIGTASPTVLWPAAYSKNGEKGASETEMERGDG